MRMIHCMIEQDAPEFTIINKNEYRIIDTKGVSTVYHRIMHPFQIFILCQTYSNDQIFTNYHPAITVNYRGNQTTKIKIDHGEVGGEHRQHNFSYTQFSRG